MSYNLSFWKYKENSYLDNHKVYETLCDEGNIEGLENVPVDEIREKIAKAFSDWNKVDENSFENSNKGAFQIEDIFVDVSHFQAVDVAAFMVFHKVAEIGTIGFYGRWAVPFPLQ